VSSLKEFSQKSLAQPVDTQRLEGLMFGLGAVLDLIESMKTAVKLVMEEVKKG
jgi:hypothetical protein